MNRHDLLWWNGRFVRWDEARVHVTSETALRGLNVFEGIRAYSRRGQDAFAVVGLDAHLERLRRSAITMQIPMLHTTGQWRQAVIDLLLRLPCGEDLYIRPTIYVDRGSYEADATMVDTGAFISWRLAPYQAYGSMSCGVSSWVRIPSRCLPAEAKTGATYTAFRLARLEVKARGFDEAILLNEHGQVAETPGGSILCITDSVVRTPPLDADILPSITRQIVLETLCPALGLQIQVGPLHVSDLRTADEVLIAGTLDGLARIHRLEERNIDDPGDGSRIRMLQELYHGLCLGTVLQSSRWVEIVEREDMI